VIGDDHRRVELPQGGPVERDRTAAGEAGVLAGRRHDRNVRIVTGLPRAAGFEPFPDGERRAFAHVVDVLLVGDAEEQDLRAVEVPAEAPVELPGEAADASSGIMVSIPPASFGMWEVVNSGLPGSSRSGL
jgi:hypothetical protein